MAGTIQGLTVVINGDATPLTRAMRQLKSEATTLRGHMTALNKLIKFDPSSTTLITRQQQLLNAQLSQTAAQLATLRTAHAEYADLAEKGVTVISELTQAETRQFQNLQRRITEAELQYARLSAAAVEYGAAVNASTLAAAGRLSSVSQALSKVSTGFLVAGASAGVFLGLSIKSAYDFENSFAGVRKTIIATDEEYQKLARSTRDIALTKPIDVNDVNEIMMYAGQLGIANNHLTKFASTMADLDVATDMDLEEGSMQLARFSNIVGMSQGDVDRLGATIVDLGNNSATTESQIMLMAMRIAGTGSNLGMTASDVLALAATLSSLGIQAEMGGNAISTIMRKIDKDVALDTENLGTWASVAGMSAEEFKAAWEGDVTNTLLKVMGGMGKFQDQGNNLNVLLDELGINYMRQVDTLQRFSRAEELGTSLVERASVAWDQNTALVREANQRYDTAASKTKMMMNAFNELGITVGNEILPAFKDIVLGITDAVKGFASMDDSTKTLIVNMGGFTVAAALAVKAAQGITGGLSSLIRGYASLKTSLAQATVNTMSYTQMTIAENGVLDANTIAKLRNTEAEVAAARAKAQTLKEYAAGLAAKGMDTEATTVLAMAERAEAEAATQEAAAHDMARAAAVGDAQSKGMLAVATEAAKAKLGTFAASMGVSTGVAAGMAAGLVAAVAAVALLAKAFSDAFNPVDQLTRAAQEQKDVLDQHEAEYKRLVEAEGEHSEAAIKARAALEEEREEFKKTGLTVGEFCENMSEARKEQEELSATVNDSLVTAENEAGSMLNLVDSIVRLGENSNKSSDDIALMHAQVDALNRLVPDLNLTIDETTGAVTDQTGAWQALVKQTAEAKVAETALEGYNKLIAQQPQLQENLTAAVEQYNAEAAQYVDLVNAGAIAMEDVPPSAQMAIQALHDSQKAIDDNNAAINKQLEAYTTYANKQSVLKSAVQDFATYTGQATGEQERAAEIAAKYTEMLGQEVTAEDVLNAVLADRAQRQAEAAQANEEMVESLTDLNMTNEVFAAMLADSGLSLDELAQRLTDAGISADEFAQSMESMADRVSDGFNRIEQESNQSLEDFVANLEHNMEVTRNWSSNMDLLWGEVSNSYEQDFLRYVASLGPEYAEFVQQMVNDSDGFHEAAAKWHEAANEGSTAAVTSQGVVSASFQKAKDDATNRASETSANVKQSMGDMTRGMRAEGSNVQGAANNIAEGIRSINRYGDKTYGWGSSTGGGFASGLRSSQGAVSGASQNILNAVENLNSYNGSAHTWGWDLGINFANGISRTYSFVESAVNSLASAVQSFLGHSIAEKGPLHNGGKGEIGWGQEMVGNLVDGMRSREPQLRAAALSLASDLADPFENPLGGDWMSTGGAQRLDWYAMGASREGAQARPVSVTADITGNNFFIREEADVDKVAQAIADKVNREVALA